MSHSTPGRRRNETKHTKFNPDPKTVGTYSGQPMPHNVPRDSNGMEDAEEFFRSSPTAPTTGQTTRTRRGDTATPGSSARRKGRMSQLEDEGSGDDTFGGNGAGADELLVDDEFPDGEAAAPFFRTKTPSNVPLPSSSNIQPRTPGSASAAFNALPSPSSGSPRTYARNRVNNSTARKGSTIGVGYRPSPVAQASTIGVGAGGSGASRKSGASGAASRAEEADYTGEMDMELDLDELDGGVGDDTGLADTTRGAEEDEGDEDEEEEAPVVKGKGKAGKGKGKARVSGESNSSVGPGRKSRKDPDDDEGGDGRDDDVPNDLGPDPEEEDDEEEPAVSRSELIQKGKQANKGQRGKTAVAVQEPEEDEGDDDLGGGGGGGDVDVDVNDFGGDGGMDGPEGDEEDDVELERAAVDAEEEPRSGDEEMDDEDEAEAAPVRKKGKGKAPAAKAQMEGVHAGTGGRNKRKPNGEVISRRTRLSRVNNEDYEGNGVEGDFMTRRSGRQHMAPLQSWRGERVEWRKGEHGTEIACVVHIPIEPAQPLAARNKKKGGRARSQSVRPGAGGRAGSRQAEAVGVINHHEAGWDDMTTPNGNVIDYETGTEIERRVVFPARLLHPKIIQGEGFFKYQKVFGDDVFMASGVLELPSGHGFKPEKSSKDNSYTFFVASGAINIKVHKTSYILAPGGMTLVPRGNKYSIENISPNDAVLYFSQARKIRMREDEEAAHDANQGPSQSQIVPIAKRKRGSMRSVQEDEQEDDEGDNEEQEEERSEEEEVEVRIPVKGKKKAKTR